MPDCDILPITVIIPTLNCVKRIKRHMEDAVEWLPYVQQAIVVDSYSTDGTIELIQEYVDQFDLTILNCPKGLYSSWNYGVSHAECPYVYFSTVSDTITLSGLKKLYHAAEQFRAEVVISPPKFVCEEGAVLKENRWPIHEIIECLGLEEPVPCDQRLLYDFILVYLERGILGSSASNLYRAETLKRLPFSEDYYSAGDSAWMVENCFDVRTAIHPEVISTFLFHEKDWSFCADDIQSGQMLRQRFAFEAFIKSIENTRTLSQDLAVRCQELVRQALDTNQTSKYESLRDLILLLEDFRKLKKLDVGKSYEFRAIMLRIEFLCEREIGQRYRKSIGAVRNVWPPSLNSRRKLKKLRTDLAALINDVPVADYFVKGEEFKLDEVRNMS